MAVGHTAAPGRLAHRRRSYSVGNNLDALLHSHSNRAVAFSSLRGPAPPAPLTPARSHVIHTSASQLQHLPALAIGRGHAAAQQQPWSDGLMGDATLVDDAPPPPPGTSTIVVVPGHHLRAADVVQLLGPHAAHFERRHSTRSVRSVGSVDSVSSRRRKHGGIRSSHPSTSSLERCHTPPPAVDAVDGAAPPCDAVSLAGGSDAAAADDTDADDDNGDSVSDADSSDADSSDASIVIITRDAKDAAPAPPLPFHQRHPLEFHLTIFVAVLLALNAGVINGCTLLSFRVTVAHVTGAVTRTGAALPGEDASVFALYGSCVVAFLAGSVCVGYWLPHRAFQRGVAHGALFLAAAALLAAACLFAFYSPGFAHEHREYFLSLAAAACGMQNALSSRYSANIFRTTHLTGTLTDLGVLLGRLLAGDCREELWKAYVMVSLVLGFFLGGIVSVYLVRDFGDLALLWSAGAMALFGALVVYVTATRCEAQWWAALEALGVVCLQRAAAAADATSRAAAALWGVCGADSGPRKRQPGDVPTVASVPRHDDDEEAAVADLDGDGDGDGDWFLAQNIDELVEV